ncbi:O-antigen ligase family protein [Planctomycetota bacterium]
MNKIENMLTTDKKWLSFLDKYGNFFAIAVICCLSLLITPGTIAFNILLGSLIALVIFLSPEKGLLLFIVLMPLHVILGKKAFFPGQWKEAVLVMIFLSWLIKGLIKKRLVFPKSKANIPIIVFIVYCIALLCINIGDFKANIMGLRNLLQYIMVYFLTVAVIPKREHLKKYIFFFLTAGTLIALTNTIHYLSNPVMVDKILHQPYHSGSKFLAYDFLGANNYAYYLDTLICISIGLFLFIRSRKVKCWLIISTCILVTSLLLTYSKGGLLALTVAVSLWALKTNKKILLVLLLLYLGAFFLAPSTMYERFFTSVHYKEAIGIRAGFYPEQLRLALSNPVFGIGMGKVGAVSQDALQPHSYYLYLLLQTGIVGLILYAWIFLTFLKQSLNLYKNLNDRFFKGLTAGIIMYYVVFAISAIFVASGEAFLSAFIFWFLGGVVAILSKSIQQDRPHILSVCQDAQI